MSTHRIQFRNTIGLKIDSVGSQGCFNYRIYQITSLGSRIPNLYFFCNVANVSHGRCLNFLNVRNLIVHWLRGNCTSAQTHCVSHRRLPGLVRGDCKTQPVVAVPSGSGRLSLFRTITTARNRTEPSVNRRLGLKPPLMQITVTRLAFYSSNSYSTRSNYAGTCHCQEDWWLSTCREISASGLPISRGQCAGPLRVYYIFKKKKKKQKQKQKLTNKQNKRYKNLRGS